MTSQRDVPRLRVERALRLLPDIDLLAPLRTFLISTSKVQPATEPYRTVGKRIVQSPVRLREMVPGAIAEVTQHLAALYLRSLDALEAEQRGDLDEAVRALLGAGDLEERAGRLSQARIWFDHALSIAEGLHDRHPEIDALLRLGRIATVSSDLAAGARAFQRAFVIADNERNARAAASACLGLGDIALQEDQFAGADSWFTRGLEHASDDPALTAFLYLGLARSASRRGQHDAAEQRIAQARDLFEGDHHDEGIVWCLDALGSLAMARSEFTQALAHHSEALARLSTAAEHPQLELEIRLHLSDLFLAWGRIPDAEDELRRAEDRAILHNLPCHLARLYVKMGQVRAHRRDETGFVFFEKAIELSRGLEPFPRLEAEVYLEYGRFRKHFEQTDDARACIERAREILDGLGNGPALSRVTEELALLDA